jgi:predicted nucleic acid-binding protein
MPEFHNLRVYLDANVLFSASHDESSRFVNFWRLRGAAAVTSQYAVGEVYRNIESIEHLTRFESLLVRTQFVSDVDVRLIPVGVVLVAKDQPILAAAIAASVDYLVTGDKRHFTHLYAKTISGVQVISPTYFLFQHKDRLPE